MAIKSYVEENQTYYEVYVHGHDSRGSRVQWRRRVIETLRKAETVEFELKRKLAVLKEERVDPKFHEWVAECLQIMKLSYRPSTLYSYQSTINKWLIKPWREEFLREISKQKIHTLLYEAFREEMTEHTRKYVLKIIKRIFQIAVDHGHLDRNPANGMVIKVPESEKKVLTATEVKTFLREAKATNHRFYPIWVMALFTGMRSGELYALRWSDIDFENEVIKVGRSWSSKNGFTSTKNQKSRVVPISGELQSFLKEWKLSGETKDFVLPHLSEWTRGDAADVIRMFCQSIEVTKIRFHDLRATFITNLLTRGESLARVMAIVGHADIDTTNVYLRLAGVDLKGATDRLSFEIPEEQKAKVLRLPSFGTAGQ
ncbi:MAG: site-specific integrase [Xanthomonadaceae bacterium]|nr:site-specific integrase [Xanthomonadaceae bacterium]